MLAHVRSAMGYPAYYPVHPVAVDRPLRAVLMDLDGTSVRSEGFWVWIIELTTASLVGNPRFELEDADLPYVSGHSVSEHLQHCIRKYAPSRTVEAAREYYFAHTRREMQAIVEGRGRADAFVPAPGLKPFLLALKARGIRIALVPSGLHEKAYPEIPSASRTLGELSPKPHPWLYAEVARVGLGIPFEARHEVVGIEDSGAGVCAIRLAGFAAFGLSGGTIVESGTRPLCEATADSLDQLLPLLV